MIKKLNNFVVLLLIILLTSNIASAQKDVKLSLFTCGTGSELYSSFGHSAIRVVSASDSIDMIYNFGIFDFNDPEFYSKFMNGIMLYMLGTQQTEDFLMDYVEENRWVNEQKINLPDSTQIALVEWLKFTRKPENRKYYYDFLRNNCSSKLRDIVMIMQYQNIKFNNPRLNKTHRDLIAECLRENKWSNFGINILLSSLIDKKVTPFDEMFLPDYLSKHGEEATINGTPILGKPVLVNKIPITYPTWHFSFTDPIMIMLYLLIISVLYRKNWLRNSLFIIIGLFGAFLVFMWFGTEQTYVKYNYNILWLNPLYLALVPFFAFKKQLVSFWLLATILLCQLIVIVAWIFGLQSYDIAFFPMMVMLLVYGVRELINLKKKLSISCC
jgi:hypothetical protein